MLLNSVILILREVLEAAMLISVLLALSLNLRCGVRWFWWALPVGLGGTVLLASGLEMITDALDGAGQEVVNAALQGLVYCFTVGIVWFSVGAASSSQSQANILTILMTCAIALAMIREGSEVLVYISGFAAAEAHRTAVYAGSAIGAGIGLSLGVLLFSTLRELDAGLARKSCLVLACLMGAGMVVQSTMLLEQVDWLSVGHSLWDSSGLISEQSIIGELLYAVFGYESTPSRLQAVLYTASILIAVVAYVVARSRTEPVHVD